MNRGGVVERVVGDERVGIPVGCPSPVELFFDIFGCGLLLAGHQHWETKIGKSGSDSKCGLPVRSGLRSCSGIYLCLDNADPWFFAFMDRSQ